MPRAYVDYIVIIKSITRCVMRWSIIKTVKDADNFQKRNKKIKNKKIRNKFKMKRKDIENWFFRGSR